MKEKLLTNAADATAFKIAFMMLTLLSFNGLFARQFYLTWIAYAVTAFGAVTLLARLILFKQYIHVKGLFIMAAFCASYILSALLTRQYGLVENLKALIWMAFQYFILFAYNTYSDTEHEKKEFDLISHIFMVYTFYAAIIGIIMLFSGYYKFTPIDGTAVIIGFLWNRLWGIYTDPNYGAVFATITIIMCLYNYKSAKRPMKVFYIINIVSQILYIAYSDSRTGMVALAVSLFAYIYLIQIREKKFASMKTFTRGAVCVLLSLAVIVSTFAAIKVASVSTSAFKKWQYEYRIKNSTNQVISDKEKEKLAIGRQSADINGDVSNRRFEIWKSGFEIFKSKPLTGVTFRNYIPYAEDNLPDTYIVNNNFGKFPSLHNSFIDIMASQGIIGMLIIAAFILMVLITIFKNFFKFKGEKYKYNSYLLCIILPVLVSMMFYSETFYMNTCGAFMFWLVLGYLIQILSKENLVQGANHE